MRLREGAPQGPARPTLPSAQNPSHLGATLVSCFDKRWGRPGIGVVHWGLCLHLVFAPSACGAACWGRPGSPQADATSAPLPRYGRGRESLGVQEAGLRSLKTSLSSAGRELFDDPSYVNIQNLDKARHAGGGAAPPNLAVNGSAPRDLFDMSECFSILYPHLSTWFLFCSFLPGLCSLKILVLDMCCASCLS